MGRGGDVQAPGGTEPQVTRRRADGPQAPIRAGSRWRHTDGGREIEIIGAQPGHAHIALIARDQLSSFMISPAALRARYEPSTEADGEGGIEIDVNPPAPLEDVPRPLIRGGEWERILADIDRTLGREPGADEDMSPKQAGYLARLCKEAGERFDPTLSKKQASLMIDRLKRLSGA